MTINPPQHLAPALPVQRPVHPTLRRRRWLAVLLGLVVAAALFESTVRLARLGSPVYAPRRFEPDGKVPFALLTDGGTSLPVYQPNTVFASVYDPAGDQRRYLADGGKVFYRINADGMRGGVRGKEKPPDAYRILCLGDSITFGEGVHEEHTYPSRLEHLLAAAMPDRRVEVLNAGVQGYGTREEVALYIFRGRAFSPDAVIVGFFLNDAVEFSETIRQNDAQTHGYQPSGPARLLKTWEILARSLAARRLQADYFDTIRRSFDSPIWEQDKKLLGLLTDEARNSGFRLIVLIFPVLWELDGNYPFEDLHGRIAAACRAAGCECIDLLETYRGHPAESLWVHPTDHHPNELAHRLAAERLAAILHPPPRSD